MRRTESKAVRVLICNRYALFREGIKALLPETAGIEIVGEARTGRQALGKVERLHPDIVLMDAASPDCSAAKVTREMKRIDPRVEVLILSLCADERLIAGCLAAGAAGFLRSDDRPGQLKSVIHALRERHGQAA